MLNDKEIHLWRIPLDRTATEISRYESLLDAAEIARSAGMHARPHLRRFIVSHGGLRVLLGQYLDADPGSLEFAENEHGKPRLADGFADSNLHFNLAHAHELAVVALCRGHAVGVDVEWPRKDRDLDRIVHRFFAPREIADYERLRESRRVEAFYNGWTRKEAFIKAVGDGLRHPLDSFEVSLAPGDAARVLRVGDDPAEAGRWQLNAFDPAPGYVGAVAVHARDFEIVLCRN